MVRLLKHKITQMRDMLVYLQVQEDSIDTMEVFWTCSSEPLVYIINYTDDNSFIVSRDNDFLPDMDRG